MKTKKNKYELLAPAGSMLSLIAAVNAGADAIYFGLQDFSMRAKAKNFSINDLDEIEKVCEKGHLGIPVKKYLTLNTIIYDEELGKIEKLIKKVRGKVDAIICWDLAIIELCRKNKIPFFVSTQASVANSEAAKFYKKLGAKRVVLARELNLKQIKKISKLIDIECFCHGAMCVSVSGRCFTSQFQCGKSANRGECLQPCRRSYIVKDDRGNELKVVNSHIFSAKDLCTLPFIEELKNAGIKSFKIEGRNRDPEYVDTVVRVYRRALDKKLSSLEIKESLKELEKVYNKGFSSGFYLGTPTNDDFSDVDHSKAKETKEFIGKVVKYYPKIGVAVIYANSGFLKTGDDIFVLSDKTGFSRMKVERIEIEKKEVSRVEKGNNFGIKIPNARAGDEIYKVVKNE